MEVPECFIGGYYNCGADQKQSGEHFRVDDLLDFPNEDDVLMSDGFFDNIAKADSSTFASNDTSNSSSGIAGNYHAFSSELCVPNDDLAELEWLSNFMEDSFSTGQNLQTNFHGLSGSKPQTPESSSSDTIQPEPMARNNAIFRPETPLPGKARSKRSRAAPCDWTTRLLHLSPSEKGGPKRNSSSDLNSNLNSRTELTVRKCLHCAAEKTPQWRTGPMGPKTLCNACGVRYKSGRLVPEYRPAASPTFVSTKHSNSHRKVLELRRQKDMQRVQHEQFLSQASIFGVSNGGDDFLIHHHGDPNFRHMI